MHPNFAMRELHGLKIYTFKQSDNSTVAFDYSQQDPNLAKLLDITFYHPRHNTTIYLFADFSPTVEFQEIISAFEPNLASQFTRRVHINSCNIRPSAYDDEELTHVINTRATKMIRDHRRSIIEATEKQKIILMMLHSIETNLCKTYSHSVSTYLDQTFSWSLETRAQESFFLENEAKRKAAKNQIAQQIQDLKIRLQELDNQTREELSHLKVQKIEDMELVLAGNYHIYLEPVIKHYNAQNVYYFKPEIK